MKKNRDNPNARPTISSEALALEIKNARTHFELSSNWLFGLSEQIASFPDMSISATEILRKLQKRALKGRINNANRKSVHEVLRALRLYSRIVASEDEPLSCIDTVESVVAFEEHLAQLKSVLKRLSRLQLG
jgi:hypothetical protein